VICIRDLIVDPPTFLSPMAGLTDSVFRRLIKRLGGCGLVMTEFTSAEGLTRNSLKSKRMLFYHEEERPVTAQLFGADPSRLAEATRMVEDLGFDAIDLNLGCPAKKVVKACGGSALLRETKLLEEILKTIRGATSLPFTIKIRAGWSETEIVSVQVGKMAEDIGINAIAFHPRTRVQGFSGHSDWNLIGQLKAALKIPVIGNGDIVTPEDAFRMKRETGCDGVMIGRGAQQPLDISPDPRAREWLATHSAGCRSEVSAHQELLPAFVRRRDSRRHREDETVCLLVYACHSLRSRIAEIDLRVSDRERSDGSY
jgi:tRNA-dihydrouridine synthase B